MIDAEAAAMAVERRLRLLGAPDEDDEVHDAASRAAAQRFLDALGSYSEPAVFILPCGHYRLVWQDGTGDRTEQFAVSFAGTGKANVVYTDPLAAACGGGRTLRRRMVVGGLVGVTTNERDLIDVLLESGHDAHVREGVPPGR